MSVLKCPECGGMVSSTCDACPHCGYRIKPKVGKAIFRCARNQGIYQTRFKVDIRDETKGVLIHQMTQDDIWSMPVTRVMKLSIHVHAFFGTEYVTVKPGEDVEIYVNTRFSYIEVKVVKI